MSISTSTPCQGEGTFVVKYLGASMLDNRIFYTDEMVPWIISEILRFAEDEQVILQVRAGSVSVFSTKYYHNRNLYAHDIRDCIRHFQVTTGPNPGPVSYFGLIVKSSKAYHHVRLFSGKKDQVAEIISTLSEASKLTETTPSAVMMSPGIQDASDTISFEVLYLGKLRMSYKKAPLTFVDDALEKFRTHDPSSTRGGSQESQDRARSSSRESTSSRHSPLLKSVSDSTTMTKAKLIVPQAPFPHPLDDVAYTNGTGTGTGTDSSERCRTASGDSGLTKSLSLPTEPLRSRALSTGNDPRAQVLETGKPSGFGNRTMILILVNREVRIVSPDAKTVLLHKAVSEISQTAKGLLNKNCFGFICRETATTGTIYVGFIFRCESDSICADILQTLKRVATAELSPKKKQVYCDHCPMIWYHHLCVDVDGLPDDRARGMILKRIDDLNDEDRENILIKLSGAETPSTEEQLELMMMLIRAHCETKQLHHVHDTPENRHEFLQTYLGGGGGAILMKAKKSLTSSFDQFLKRKELKAGTRGFNPLLPHHVIHQGKEMSPGEHDPRPLDMTYSDSPLEHNFRKRSSTLGAVATSKIISELHLAQVRRGSTHLDTPTTSRTSIHTLPLRPLPLDHSPMMNIFLKVGPQSSMSPTGSSGLPVRKGSWRQAIFKRVVSPSTGKASTVPGVTPVTTPASAMTPLSSKKSSSYRPRKTKQEVQDLWRSAIKQQILLNRMDRQNNMLKSKQEEASLKRNKLSYSDMCSSGDYENHGIDVLVAGADGGQLCDMSVFRAICITGIPKHRRGQVWEIFVDQYRLRGQQESEVQAGASTLSPATLCPNTSYDQLLRQLTSHQHAILIDLGRTFPNHVYFNRPLGSGQLALFNLLKAYSLLDPDVGYCQGLSFVAGLLLMHLEEEEAFGILKHFMFEMGGREYYRPDMSGLQLKLYQLNRLIHDTDPDIHLLLYHNDVLPSLYAAPWFLTMFASQFPIGFSVRVMDLALVQGPDVMVKFALLLILDHKKHLMECSGLEQIMECFKNVVTQISPTKVDEYVKKAFDMKIKRQMLVYGIEYSVMQDETFLAYLTDPKNKGQVSRERVANQEGQSSPTPSVTGSEEDSDSSLDLQVLFAYLTSLEGQLRALGQPLTRPPNVVRALERRSMTFNNLSSLESSSENSRNEVKF